MNTLDDVDRIIRNAKISRRIRNRGREAEGRQNKPKRRRSGVQFCSAATVGHFLLLQVVGNHFAVIAHAMYYAKGRTTVRGAVPVGTTTSEVGAITTSQRATRPASCLLPPDRLPNDPCHRPQFIVSWRGAFRANMSDHWPSARPGHAATVCPSHQRLWSGYGSRLRYPHRRSAAALSALPCSAPRPLSLALLSHGGPLAPLRCIRLGAK